MVIIIVVFLLLKVVRGQPGFGGISSSIPVKSRIDFTGERYVRRIERRNRDVCAALDVGFAFSFLITNPISRAAHTSLLVIEGAGADWQFRRPACC